LENSEEKKKGDPSFYEAEYYQPYFDVDTKEVFARILHTLVPFTSKFFEHIKENPDLWGPFWISTSLIFLMTASVNLENYFTALIRGDSQNWAPDLQKLPW
jgi:protein YIPF1/2